jgi:hypothetical protein
MPDKMHGQHLLGVEVRQQLMELRQQKALAGHGRQITIEAVDHYYSNAIVFHFSANPVGEFSRRLLASPESLRPGYGPVLQFRCSADLCSCFFWHLWMTAFAIRPFMRHSLAISLVARRYQKSFRLPARFPSPASAIPLRWPCTRNREHPFC